MSAARRLHLVTPAGLPLKLERAADGSLIYHTVRIKRGCMSFDGAGPFARLAQAEFARQQLLDFFPDAVTHSYSAVSLDPEDDGEAWLAERCLANAEAWGIQPEDAHGY